MVQGLLPLVGSGVKPRPYFFFAAAFRTVAALDGIGVQISTEVGTRFLPAAKSVNSEAD